MSMAFKDGVLSNLRKIQPNGGYGFGPRHLDFHPTKPWVYLSVERQNKLIVYKVQPDGDLVPEPLFTRETLADPDHRIPVQGAGPIHVHPNGKFVYLGNRSGVATGIEDVDGVKVFSAGESNIAAFAINQRTGEPIIIQHADIEAAHPRTFGLDSSGRMGATAKSSSSRLALPCSRCEPTGSSISCTNTISRSASSRSGGPGWSRWHDRAHHQKAGGHIFMVARVG